MIRLPLALCAAICCQATLAQWSTPEGEVPFQDELASVKISLAVSSWDALFHPDSVWSDFEHSATFVYLADGISDTLENVGFRLRGNTSRTSGKKSFKVSFDRFDESFQWRGLDKMNLNGEHNDVSMSRARQIHSFFNESGIPSSRASHVRLYINDQYRGLYTNVEHIDGEWLEKRLPHAHGNLWKCTYPANLHDNGPNGSDYQFTPSWSNTRVYDLKTNETEDDYSALAQFINDLNNLPLTELPCAIEDQLDVNGYLRAAAGEILAGHWDNYIGNQNNFYLYQRTTDGRISYIPYDLDNTLGVQWFGEWIMQDPYNWTNDYRPLYTRLMQVDLYRNLFTWHMRELLATAFQVDAFEAQLQSWHDMANDAASDDTFYSLDYGFDFIDFSSSISENYGQHIPYGIVPFVGGRSASALLQLDPELPHPGWLMGWATGPVTDGNLVVEAIVYGNLTEVNASVQFDNGAIELHPMTDDDGDGIHSVNLSTEGHEKAAVQVVASFESGATRTSPCTPQLVWTAPLNSPLKLNEIMPLNNSYVTDENGGHADWAELTVVENGGTELLSDFFLTNRRTEPYRWRLPEATLSGGDHLVIWCDDDPEEGNLHAPFNLDASDDALYIMAVVEGEPRVVDSFQWSNALPNMSWARLPDGIGNWEICTSSSDVSPTPHEANETGAGMDLHQHLTAPPYPNPMLRGEEGTVTGAVSGEVLDATGRTVIEFAGEHWSAASMPSGCAVIRWQTEDGVWHHSPVLIID